MSSNIIAAVIMILFLFAFIAAIYFLVAEIPPPSIPGFEMPCVERWGCTEWSECVNDTKTRTCIDENNCNTTKKKPIEIDSCSEPISDCGNDVCDDDESCSLCPDDCGRCNGKDCLVDEMCESGHCVHGICRITDPYCGDGYCDSGETCETCTRDCGECPGPGPCTPSWGSWENQGCGVNCFDAGLCLITEQCQKKSDGCGNHQYQCVVDDACEVPSETNVSKQDYFDFGEQLLKRMISYTETKYVDYKGDKIPVVHSSESFGSNSGNTRLALALAMYSSITGKEEIELIPDFNSSFESKTYKDGIKSVNIENEYKHGAPDWGEIWAPVFLFENELTGKAWKWGGNFENIRIESISYLDSETIRIYGEGIEFILKPKEGYRKITVDENFLTAKNDRPLRDYIGWQPVQVGDVVEFQAYDPKAVYWNNRGEPFDLGQTKNVMHYHSYGTVKLKRGEQTFEGVGSFQHAWMDYGFYTTTGKIKLRNAFHIYTEEFIIHLQSIIAGEYGWRDGGVYFLDDGSYDVLGNSVGGFAYEIIDGPEKLSFNILIDTHKGKVEIDLTDPNPDVPAFGFQDHWIDVKVTIDGRSVNGIMATSETERKIVTNMITLVRGLINSQLLKRPITFSMDASSALHLFGDNLDENSLWQNLTDIEKTYWKEKILPIHTQWNSESFEAFAAYYSYKFGWDIDKTPEWFDAQLDLYTSQGWQRPEYNIYSWFSLALMRNLQQERKSEGFSYDRITEFDEYYDRQLDHIKYAAGTNGEVWTWGRSTGTYGIGGFIGPLENAISFGKVSESNKGIFKRIAHLSFLRAKDYYYNETLGLLDASKKPYPEMIVYGFNKTIPSNAQFVQSLFMGYMNADESVKESDIPAETHDYEKFFPFAETGGVRVYNEVGVKHYSVVEPVMPISKTEIDNSLEYLRARGLGVQDTAEYVISKSLLGTEIPNKKEIIDYFDANQNELDGAWHVGWTPMFTTHRVLLAYYMLNATPKKSLDPFFAKYDEWSEVQEYDNFFHPEPGFDGRNAYHIAFGWVIYGVISDSTSVRGYPPWLNQYFNQMEYDLSWTTSEDYHKRTHILYTYVIARHDFPNLDDIITETIDEQRDDGHWDHISGEGRNRTVYGTSIQLVLLSQIQKLYPGYRSSDINNSIQKSRQWFIDNYHTQILDSKTCGYFGDILSIEDALMTGIMSIGINELLDINVDMTFEDLVKGIQKPKEFEFDVEAYKNFLDYGINTILEKRVMSGSEIIMMAYVVDGYNILQSEIPRKQEVINYFNSAQRDDGTWPGECEDGAHYAPATAHVLMKFDALGAEPSKSLTPYYEKVNTWEKVDNEIRKEQWCAGYWGESWGHIAIPVVDKKQQPLWIDEWFQYSENNFDKWVNNSHQRVHYSIGLYHLCMESSRKQEVIDIMLESQLPDGSWENKDTETAASILALNWIGASGPEVEEAKQKALDYLLPLYHEWYQDGKKMAAFKFRGRDHHPGHSIMTALVQEGIISGHDPFVDYKVCEKLPSNSYIMDMPVFPEDEVPKVIQGKEEVARELMPWVYGIGYDENGKVFRFHIGVSNVHATCLFVINGKEYRRDFDSSDFTYSDGVLTADDGSSMMTVDYHAPHAVAVQFDPTSSINFVATYRGPPLWYGKTTNPDDTLPTPDPAIRLGGYDAPIEIVGKIIHDEQVTNFNAYGIWERVWWTGGRWESGLPSRSWMCFNSEDYYAVVAEVKSQDDILSFHVGRVAEAGGSAYVFDNFQWSDDGEEVPLDVELNGPIRDAQGNIKGTFNLKTNPEKAKVITNIWAIYGDVSGNVLGNVFTNGTAWVEMHR